MDEAALHDLLSGRRRGLVAAGLRSGLWPLSLIYTFATSVRNLAYDTRLARVHRAAAPVISLGNITTGGTGKTPMAAWLANWLVAAGHKPGLISRGYRSLNADPESRRNAASPTQSANDEKLVLDRLCPGIPHLQQQDRVQSAARAVTEFGCDSLILDDGFQHRRLHRNLDIVLIDALQPWGYGYVLPRGLLRERLSGLRRADLIVITRADQCTEAQRLILRAMLIEHCGQVENVEVAFRPNRLLDPNWQSQMLSLATGKRILAFCGIGNPDGFHRTVKMLTAAPVQLISFPDHHHYNLEELAKLAEQAREHSADIVLTTTKDLVKIPAESWTGPPLFAVHVDVEFISGLDRLETLLRTLFENFEKTRS